MSEMGLEDPRLGEENPKVENFKPNNPVWMTTDIHAGLKQSFVQFSHNHNVSKKATTDEHLPMFLEKVLGKDHDKAPVVNVNEHEGFVRKYWDEVARKNKPSRANKPERPSN